jgi:hypothetical protein
MTEDEGYYTTHFSQRQDHACFLKQMTAFRAENLGRQGVDVLHFCTQAPVVISRDHHDVSGTDSPYRETSNVTDGSALTAGEGSEGFQNSHALTAQDPRDERHQHGKQGCTTTASLLLRDSAAQDSDG